MNGENKFNLKLLGKNQEDLRVISAYLQDSVVIVKDIVFLKKNRTFVMLVNRFMWEDVEQAAFRQNKRVRCAVKFENVIKVESKNINQNNKNKTLEYLALECSLNADETHCIKIFFSGDSIITMNVEIIDVDIQDLGKTWNVKYIPKHKI